MAHISCQRQRLLPKIPRPCPTLFISVRAGRERQSWSSLKPRFFLFNHYTLRTFLCASCHSKNLCWNPWWFSEKQSLQRDWACPPTPNTHFLSTRKLHLVLRVGATQENGTECSNILFIVILKEKNELWMFILTELIGHWKNTPLNEYTLIYSYIIDTYMTFPSLLSPAIYLKYLLTICKSCSF